MIAALDRNRFLRFLAAGGLNTLVGFAVYSGAIMLGSSVWSALLLATLAGLFFNFFTTGGYAFRCRLLTRFPRFAAAYAGLYAINWLCIDWLAGFHLGAIAAQALLTIPLAVLSYGIMSRFVFPSEEKLASKSDEENA